MANIRTLSKHTKDAEEDLGYLSFRVSPEFKREFKTYAASHDVSMTDLLVTAFQALKKAEKQKLA
jgi:hypothetical protein